MLGRTIKYCDHRPVFLSASLDQTPASAWTLNNFAALSRWHLAAYFLSYPFISCHFSEASQVAAAKRDGRWLEVTDTRQHSGHRQHPGLRLTQGGELGFG